MQISSKLVYIFIFKQIISLTEAIQYSFWCIDWLNNMKKYLQFTFIDLKLSLNCCVHSFIIILNKNSWAMYLDHCTWHWWFMVNRTKHSLPSETFHLVVKKSVWWICECYRISKIIYVLVEFSLKELEDSWTVNQDRNGDYLVH